MVLLVLASMPFLFGSASRASAETRTLKIHFVHTGEKAAITFKRNGKYDPQGLRQLNMILRDWRRNEPTKMDPRLFDLVWEVYRRAGATGYITAVSGYRSPATNAMLRSRSKGVAKESQHMQGTAMDFYIPGVPLARIREIAIKLQAGGVGYYPRSGSPFVHLDVASVRAWPRMTRQELVRLFPDGKTVHLPSDGKPLPGYQQAMAEYKRRLASGGGIMMADSKSSPSRPRNLLAMLFGGGDEDEEEDVGVPAERPQVAPSAPVAEPPPRQQPQPQQQQILTAAAPVQRQPVFGATTPPAEMVAVAENAPVPLARPSVRATPDTSLAVALYSPARSAAEDALTQVASGAPAAAPEGFTDLQAVNAPVPTLLGARNMRGDAEKEILTASVGPVPALAGDGSELHVPVPVARPAVAEALLAAADADMEAETDEVEQAILSPEAAEALEQSRVVETDATEIAAVPVPSAAPMASNVAPAPATSGVAAVPTPPQKPVVTSNPAPHSQVAMLTAPKPVMRPVDFGDAFDAPKEADTGIETGMPAKGKRPSKTDAETAHRAVTGAPVLTTNMLSTWALNRERTDAAPKPGKAARLAARPFVTDSGGVYAVGFKTNPPPQVDPGRFGQPAKP